jgi:hypothetical protein
MYNKSIFYYYNSAESGPPVCIPCPKPNYENNEYDTTRYTLGYLITIREKHLMRVWIKNLCMELITMVKMELIIVTKYLQVMI